MRRASVVGNLLAAAVLVATWAYAAHAFRTLPPRIPTHFGFSGTPNSYGPKSSLWLVPAIQTVLFVVLCAVQILGTRKYRAPFAVRDRAAAAQLMRAFVAVLNVLVAAAFADVTWMTIAGARGESTRTAIVLLWIAVAAIVASCVAYVARLWSIRARG